MSDFSERYGRHAAIFDAKVTAVPENAWNNPSPNEGWTTFDVVKHVVDSSNHFLSMVQLTPVASDGDDIVKAWHWLRDTVLSGLENPDIAQREIDTPLGTYKWEVIVDRYLTFDLVVHAWDVARGAGIDESLDSNVVSDIHAEAEQLAETGRAMGAFGPKIEVPEDAEEIDKLLGLLGRQR